MAGESGPRAFVQITASAYELFGLANDGTIWRYRIDNLEAANRLNGSWVQLRGVPQPKTSEAADAG